VLYIFILSMTLLQEGQLTVSKYLLRHLEGSVYGKKLVFAGESSIVYFLY